MTRSNLLKALIVLKVPKAPTYRVSTPIIEHMPTIKHPNSSVGTSSLTNAHDLVTIQAIV
jgi:hypothetical protein